jgi:hypothetical protein
MYQRVFKEILKNAIQNIEASYNRLMKCKKKTGLLDKEEDQTLNWILSSFKP